VVKYVTQIHSQCWLVIRLRLASPEIGNQILKVDQRLSQLVAYSLDIHNLSMAQTFARRLKLSHAGSTT